MDPRTNHSPPPRRRPLRCRPPLQGFSPSLCLSLSPLSIYIFVLSPSSPSYRCRLRDISKALRTASFVTASSIKATSHSPASPAPHARTNSTPNVSIVGFTRRRRASALCASLCGSMSECLKSGGGSKKDVFVNVVTSMIFNLTANPNNMKDG